MDVKLSNLESLAKKSKKYYYYYVSKLSIYGLKKWARGHFVTLISIHVIV